MKNLTKIFSKIKDNPTLLVLGVVTVILVVSVLFLLSGFALIFGFNLMGFSIPYTLKSAIGAVITILCLRQVPGSSKEN